MDNYVFELFMFKITFVNCLFRDLLSYDWKVEVVHIFRETNMVVDCLISEGVDFGVYLINQPEQDIRRRI